jgi:predicted CXXCH cytochrome family protein
MNRISRMMMCAALVGLVLATALPAQDRCLSCHEGTVGGQPVELFKHDIHHARGITCAGCHGGDSKSDDMDQAMNAKAGYVGAPKGDQISKVCANCHANAEKMKSLGSNIPTNQFQNLQESVHGRLSTNGKERIVQCTTCHNAHGIVPVHDVSSPVFALNIVKTCTKCHADAAFMRMYNPSLPVDQLGKYLTSVHGIRNARGDAKAAHCASCHGSHDIRNAKDTKSNVYAANVPSACARCHSNSDYMKEYMIPTDQFDKFSRSVHGVALLKKHDLGAPACNSCHGNHAATPPGISSVSKVCGTCHALNAELFSASPHKKAFDDLKLPECETCHSNHEIIIATNELLGVTSEAVCSRCHSEAQNTKGYFAAKAMRSLTDSLESNEKRAAELVNEAEQKGMEISEAKYRLRDAHQARLESRTMVHAFNEGRFREVASKGMAVSATVSEEATRALDEYVFRRLGLGFATLAITVLAISVYVYIRRIERRQSRGVQ